MYCDFYGEIQIIKETGLSMMKWKGYLISLKSKILSIISGQWKVIKYLRVINVEYHYGENSTYNASS